MKKIVLAVAVLLSLTACTEKSEQMKELAQMSLRQSLGGGQLKILGVSEPDSTFGTNFMRPDEKKAIIANMNRVTDVIIKRTKNMSVFNPEDSYTIALAERQMRANNDLRSMLYDSDTRGEWSGWKVKIVFEAKDGHNLDYRAERWFFLDKEGNVIFKTMEFPLP